MSKVTENLIYRKKMSTPAQFIQRLNLNKKLDTKQLIPHTNFFIFARLIENFLKDHRQVYAKTS